MVGEAKKSHLDNFQTFGIPKTCQKRRKVRRGGGGSVRENGCSHAQHKKSKFFFEIFRMENFTLRIFRVHREVNRAAFDSWGRNTTQTSVEGLQDGLPHKSEGERDILQAFQQSLCSMKSTQNGCCSICLPKN